MAKWTYVVVAIAVGGSAIALAIAGLDVDKKQEEAILALPELTKEFTSWINDLGAPPHRVTIASPEIAHFSCLLYHKHSVHHIPHVSVSACFTLCDTSLLYLSHHTKHTVESFASPHTVGIPRHRARIDSVCLATQSCVSPCKARFINLNTQCTWCLTTYSTPLLHEFHQHTC